MAEQLPTSMRAAQWTTITGGLDKNLKLNTKTALPPNASSLPQDSILVKVSYASPNPVDYKLPESALFRTLLLTRPAIPCGDFSGTVVASTISYIKPGDRVFGRSDPPNFGALGEYLIVTGKENIAPIPDGVSFQDAATVGVAGLTAYQCLAPYVKNGSKVFINGGSGGTGTFGIQIAKLLGCSVTATCSTSNVDFCKSLGADDVIDYKVTDVVEYLKRQKTQYDLLIDNVNTPAIYWNAHHYLKAEGPYIAIAGTISLSNAISMAQMLFLPTWLGGGDRVAKFVLRKSNAQQYTRIAEWIKDGKVKPVIEQIYELENADQAFARLKSGRTRGKLLVKVADDQ